VLSEVAGNTAATANAKATGKVKRGIIRDCLTGANGRAKVERWVPRWMAFPPSAYTARGGVPSVAQGAKGCGPDAHARGSRGGADRGLRQGSAAAGPPPVLLPGEWR